MPGLGYTEMMMFGVLALLLFGAKLPDVARSLGGTYRELRKNMNEFQREFQGLNNLDTPAPPKYVDEEPQDSFTDAPRFSAPPEEEKS